MDVYKQHGYNNRTDYLRCISDDYGVPFYVVTTMANILGSDEDFDGLICALNDAEDFECFDYFGCFEH